ncbi:MAG: hypothetical protein KDD43_00095, partial [Bdellovibrionales bacterium]|nr:hypothetical protein [Bdellovibrionales bacterium]
MSLKISPAYRALFGKRKSGILAAARSIHDGFMAQEDSNAADKIYDIIASVSTEGDVKRALSSIVWNWSSLSFPNRLHYLEMLFDKAKRLFPIS